MADQFSGQGGSYRVTPGGERVLAFRTGLGEVAPVEKPSKRKSDHKSHEELSDGQVA